MSWFLVNERNLLGAKIKIAVMNVRFPSNEDIILPSRRTVGFSRTTLLLGVRMLKPVVVFRGCR
jgi:hypothetical protein